MCRVIQNGESFFPAINMCECHITITNQTHKFTNFSDLPVQVQNRAGQGYRVPLWGCEMGANKDKASVVRGNEAIESLFSDDLLSSQDGMPIKSLSGMDILRFALEKRSSTKHAVDV